MEIVNSMTEKITSGGVSTYHGTSYCVVPQLTVQDVKTKLRTKHNERLRMRLFFM